jgi:hypothetical protein
MIARLCAALLALGLAPPVAAAEAMSPDGFEAVAQGHVLHFTLRGAPFGAEQYFPGRRSLWRYADGTCATGSWWGEGDRVCFRYDERTDTQCWRFLDRPGGLAAELVEGGAGTGFVLELSRRDETPLACPGPKVGS